MIIITSIFIGRIVRPGMSTTRPCGFPWRNRHYHIGDYFIEKSTNSESAQLLTEPVLVLVTRRWAYWIHGILSVETLNYVIRVDDYWSLAGSKVTSLQSFDLPAQRNNWFSAPLTFIICVDLSFFFLLSLFLRIFQLSFPPPAPKKIKWKQNTPNTIAAIHPWK